MAIFFSFIISFIIYLGSSINHVNREEVIKKSTKAHMGEWDGFIISGLSYIHIFDLKKIQYTIIWQQVASEL